MTKVKLEQNPTHFINFGQFAFDSTIIYCNSASIVHKHDVLIIADLKNTITKEVQEKEIEMCIHNVHFSFSSCTSFVMAIFESAMMYYV